MSPTRLLTLTLVLLGAGATLAGAAPKTRFSTFLGSSGLDSAAAVAVDGSGRTFVLSCAADPEGFAGGAAPLSPGGGTNDVVVTRLGKSGKVERMASFGGNDFEACLALALGPDPGDAGSSLVYVLGATASLDFPTQDATQAECAGGGQAMCPGNLTITVLDEDLSEILFSTYLGGTGGAPVFFADFNGDLAVDASGRIAVVAATESKDFPTRRPTQKKPRGKTNAVVSVFEPTAGGGYRLAFSTYLGGKVKTSTTHARAVAFDGNGRLVVAGSTDDRRFPRVVPLQDGIGGDLDGFVTIYDLDTASTARSARARRVGDPEILHSTTFGGRNFDWLIDAAVEEGWLYLIGSTQSPDFPAVNPFQAGFKGMTDVVLTVLDLEPLQSSGDAPEVVVSTLFGGRQSDTGSAIAVDRKGIVHLTGTTFSRDLPTRSPVQGQCAAHPSANPDCWDSFVARFEPIRPGTAPELRFSTFLGGPQVGTNAGGEIPTELAIDKTGATYVVGRTNSPAFPTRKAAQKNFRGVVDAYVAKIKK